MNLPDHLRAMTVDRCGEHLHLQTDSPSEMTVEWGPFDGLFTTDRVISTSDESCPRDHPTDWPSNVGTHQPPQSQFHLRVFRFLRLLEPHIGWTLRCRLDCATAKKTFVGILLVSFFERLSEWMNVHPVTTIGRPQGRWFWRPRMQPPVKCHQQRQLSYRFALTDLKQTTASRYFGCLQTLYYEKHSSATYEAMDNIQCYPSFNK